MMFMKIILNKIQILSEVIESPQLNVVDCKLITESTIKLLEKMNEDTIALNNEISSAKSFSEKLGIDPENDFKKHHRRRIIPKRYDEKNYEDSNLDLHTFYRKEFKSVLDILILRLKSNIEAVV